MFYQENNRFRFVGSAGRTNNYLPANVYHFQNTRQGIFFARHRFQTDDLIKLHGSISEQIIEEVKNFFQPDTMERYKRYGMLHKRNILLHGPPGTGKSSTIYRLVEEFVDMGIVSLLQCSPDDCELAADVIREDRPDQPVVFIWEDFESWFEYNAEEILEFLDGPMSVGNSMVIATTNFLNKVPDRVKSRPSRMASVIEVPYPSAEEREAFLRSKIHKEDIDKIDIAKWVYQTEGMSLDHVKSLIISVLCMQIPVEDAVDRLRKSEVDYSEAAPHAANETQLALEF